MLFASAIPFVGRRKELERIAAFAGRATEGDGLAVLWIVGEAGIGKSRLIDRAVPDIEAGQGVVLRVRFYPETSSGIFRPLHAALAGQPHAAAIARLSEAYDPENLLTAVRRLARLRPTILIFEDLHCLKEEGTAEFIRFIGSTASEPVGLVCTTRPGDYPACRPPLPYIVQSLTLSPLLPEDLDLILQHYGMGRNGEGHGELLHRITRGVPIVIRSILPELIEINRGTAGEWSRSAEIGQLLRNKAAMSISAIVREAIDRLAPRERQAAAALAGLGEVFAEQGAKLLLGEDAPGILERLQREGIIAPPVSLPRRLAGRWDDGATWAFTHSLLHEELCAVAPLDPHLIAPLLKRDVPLYSNRPLLHLARTGRTIPDGEERLAVLEELIDRVSQQSGEQSWELLKPSFIAVCEWFAAEEPDLPEETRERLKTLLTHVVTHIRIYQPRSAELHDLIEAQFRIADPPETIHEAMREAIMIAHLPPPNYRDLPGHIAGLLDRVRELTTLFPSLAGKTEIIEALASIAGKVRLHPVRDQIRQIRDHLAAVEKELERDEENRTLADDFVQLAGHVIPLFSTPEELADRNRLAQEIVRCRHGAFPPVSICMSWSHHLIGSGRLHEGRRFLHEALLHYYQGRPTSGIPLRFILIYIDALMGAPLPSIEKSLKGLLTPAEESMGGNARGSYVAIGLALRAMGIGKMTGEFEWGYRVAVEIAGNDPHVADLHRLAGLFDGTPEGLADVIDSAMCPEAVLPLLRYAAGIDDDREAAERCAAEVLSGEIVRVEQTFELRAVVALLENSSGSGRNPLLPETRALVAEGLRRALAWCRRHNVAGAALPLLRCAEPYFSAAELAEHRNAVLLLRSEAAGEFGWNEAEEPSRLPLLKMLGTIGLVLPDQETVQRVQGARGRRILGLMVANSLMERPHGPEEFRAAAAEDEADAANTVRVAIARLRPLLGKEAIITAGNAAPRLDFSRLRVDLLEALAELDRCRRAIQLRQPRIAKKSAENALAIVRGEPAYPTLYGEFFQAARLDFELRLRQTVLAAARFLRREEDYDQAADLLGTAFEQMPNDEEVVGELTQALHLAGRNAEGVRVRASFLENSARGINA